MIENQDFKNLDHISGNPRQPHLSGNHEPNNQENKSWWSRQSIFTKILTVILGFIALFVVTEILELAERLLYQIYKVGIWVFGAFVVYIIISSIFKKS